MLQLLLTCSSNSKCIALFFPRSIISIFYYFSIQLWISTHQNIWSLHQKCNFYKRKLKISSSICWIIEKSEQKEELVITQKLCIKIVQFCTKYLLIMVWKLMPESFLIVLLKNLNQFTNFVQNNNIILYPILTNISDRYMSFIRLILAREED